MRLFRFLAGVALVPGLAASATAAESTWIPLFDGRSLDGWRASENPSTFKVVDGVLIAHGKRAHLFYEGPVRDHTFKNFELRVEVMTKPRANSGIFFHTEYQADGWPTKGYEIQINNTQSDWRRTGSLYAVADNDQAPVPDNEWFTLTIRVEGKRIVARVNDRVITDYTEPNEPPSEARFARRVLSEGTFAIQGHDPGSEVHFRKVEVRSLD